MSERTILPPTDQMNPRPKPGDYAIGVDYAGQGDPSVSTAAIIRVNPGWTTTVLDMTTGTSTHVKKTVERWKVEYAAIGITIYLYQEGNDE